MNQCADIPVATNPVPTSTVPRRVVAHPGRDERPAPVVPARRPLADLIHGLLVKNPRDRTDAVRARRLLDAA